MKISVSSHTLAAVFVCVAEYIKSTLCALHTRTYRHTSFELPYLPLWWPSACVVPSSLLRGAGSVAWGTFGENFCTRIDISLKCSACCDLCLCCFCCPVFVVVAVDFALALLLAAAAAFCKYQGHGYKFKHSASLQKRPCLQPCPCVLVRLCFNTNVWVCVRVVGGWGE